MWRALEKLVGEDRTTHLQTYKCSYQNSKCICITCYQNYRDFKHISKNKKITLSDSNSEVENTYFDDKFPLSHDLHIRNLPILATVLPSEVSAVH